MERQTMRTESRWKLKKEDTLLLSRRKDGLYAEECRILKEEGEGGSTVCYSAVFNGKKGRLKEFYPTEASYGKVCWLVYLTRGENHQLVVKKEEQSEQYRALCEDFLTAYKMLDERKLADEEHEIINNYLPVYELLYGVEEEGKKPAGVYVWTPDDTSGQSFENYLGEVYQNPEGQAIENLYNIISTVVTLTDCIRTLHAAGLLHLDIKPSNFLVSHTSSYEMNAAQISLFDIDSISPVDSEFPRVSGTVGYRAPEVDRGHAENRSDIYSIGAMLFYATIYAEGKRGIYCPEYYKQLEELVEKSSLIHAVKEQDTQVFKKMLLRILRKCLAPRPEQRYACCEELAEDLQAARMMLLPGMMLHHLSEYEGDSEEVELFRKSLMK
ncbi:MAG: hypothetical protein E7260_02750 [Lachnospiraceae bacterium]|nr:hypothetical protein [Lachnospiraceae bacterium]